jgi:osmotically-inducible protein OsmY
VVTATGDVNTYLEHAIVRSMITSNEGVKRLDDQLHVDSSVDPDEDTRIAVAKALAGEPVEARVEFGVVHLLGSVPTQEKATELANKVSKISGVIGVDSELAVRPSPLADLNLTSFVNDDVHR